MQFDDLQIANWIGLFLGIESTLNFQIEDLHTPQILGMVYVQQSPHQDQQVELELKWFRFRYGL